MVQIDGTTALIGGVILVVMVSLMCRLAWWIGFGAGIKLTNRQWQDGLAEWRDRKFGRRD